MTAITLKHFLQQLLSNIFCEDNYFQTCFVTTTTVKHILCQQLLSNMFREGLKEIIIMENSIKVGGWGQDRNDFRVGS